MKKVLAGLVVAAVPMLAVFGFGDLVFDPTNELHFLKQIEQQVTQIEQAVTQVRRTEDILAHHRYQAIFIPDKSRWATITPPWGEMSATDTYGNNGGFLGAVNYGSNAFGGYSRVVERLGVYGQVARIPGAGRVMQRYSQIELAIGAVQRAIQAMGTYRGAAPLRQAVYSDLQSRILSEEPANNTQIAVLNQGVTAQHLTLQSHEATNDLLVAMLEQQTTDAAMRQQAVIERTNTDIEFADGAAATVAKHTSGTTEALRAIRFPAY
jgi:hypothetical protein